MALCLALFAIAKVAPTQDLDFDYYGAIIGVLSFLVTLLMGYQIYTVINVKEELKEVRKTKTQIEAKLQEKGDALINEYKDELSKTVPLMMAFSSSDRDAIEKVIFKLYRESQPKQLTKELAWQTINMIIAEAAQQNPIKRTERLEEMARNVNYDEVVEFYTDFAKQGDAKKLEGMETFLLELIGLQSSKNNGYKK